MLAAAERATRPRAPGSLAARRPRPADAPGQIVMLGPGGDDARPARRRGVARELQASLHGFTFAVGHSRVAEDPVDLYRAGNEALLAANVAEPASGARSGSAPCSPSRTRAPTGSCSPP